MFRTHVGIDHPFLLSFLFTLDAEHTHHLIQNKGIGTFVGIEHEVVNFTPRLAILYIGHKLI